jgi:pyruvate kinase
MLSGETAVGAHAVDAVRTMDRIARAVEPSLSYRHQAPVPSDARAIGVAMSNAACDIAETLGAKAIIVPTFSGRTASSVARLRPQLPIIGLSHRQSSVQQLALEWGVTPVPFPEAANVEDLWNRAVEAAVAERLVEHGDLVVLTAGTAVNMPGSTNMIKVEIA